MTDLHELVASEARAALIGKTVVSARLGHGSILLIDFAAQAEPAKRAYLRIECAWILEDDELVMCASEDGREVLRKHVAKLHGRAVRDVEVRTPSLQLRLVLDIGGLTVLPVFANTEAYENWTIHTPDQKALVAGPGRSARVLEVGDPG
jgi:hypothetical protein